MLDQAKVDQALKDAKAADDAEKQTSEDEKTPKQSQATLLVEMASDATLFHDDADDCYAQIVRGDHTETHRIRSQNFRRHLVGQYYQNTAKAPSTDAISTAMLALEAQAMFEGERRQVYVRVAPGDNAIYLDLGGPSWEVVEITADGWQKRTDAPVALCRPPGLKPLPDPVPGGDISLLRNHLNIGDDGFVLMGSWLVMAMQPWWPYPVAALNGEQGTAKSSATKMVRSLIDPNTAPLRTSPRNEHDLVITAANSWVVALDNLSGTPVWLSDALCRLATGGGFSTKTLYTDRDESIFDAKRPVVVNGISDVVHRHDLADRALFITLDPIPNEDRIPERELYQRFDAEAGMILGGLLDAVATALRNMPTTNLEHLPRMADFAQWVVAAEPALPWASGEFMRVYTGNREDIIVNAIESSRLGAALFAWFEDRSFWEGTSTELLSELEKTLDEKAMKAKGWPKSPSSLGSQLKRIASFLRHEAIDIQENRTNKKRSITITRKGM